MRYSRKRQSELLERYIFWLERKSLPFCWLLDWFCPKTKAYGDANRSVPVLCKKEPVSGKYSAYDRPLEVAKKSHMVEPTGDTELDGRWRRVDA